MLTRSMRPALSLASPTDDKENRRTPTTVVASRAAPSLFCTLLEPAPKVAASGPRRAPCRYCTQEEPALKVTASGLRRAPCERPRCVARRHAMAAASREQQQTLLRLVLRSWRFEAAGSLSGAATQRLIDHHARTRALRGSLRRWRGSFAHKTLSVAERCVAAAAS